MATNPQQSSLYPGGPMTADAYFRLEQSTPNAKYEYLNGIARLMSGGSVEHDRIARNAIRLIEEHFSSGHTRPLARMCKPCLASNRVARNTMSILMPRSPTMSRTDGVATS